MSLHDAILSVMSRSQRLP